MLEGKSNLRRYLWGFGWGVWLRYCALKISFFLPGCLNMRVKAQLIDLGVWAGVRVAVTAFPYIFTSSWYLSVLRRGVAGLESGLASHSNTCWCASLLYTFAHMYDKAESTHTHTHRQINIRITVRFRYRTAPLCCSITAVQPQMHSHTFGGRLCTESGGNDA